MKKEKKTMLYNIIEAIKNMITKVVDLFKDNGDVEPEIKRLDAKARKRAYDKEYYSREDIKERQRQYYNQEPNKQRRRNYQKRYYRRNREVIKAKSKSYYHENKETINPKNKARYHKKKQEQTLWIDQ